MSILPFHLSVPVSDLAVARRFYGDVLQCKEGRSAERRIDFNFFGHHLVTHLEPVDASHKTTEVESAGLLTPCRHFGVVLPQDRWNELAERLRSLGARFHTEPQTFFPGQVTEQQVMMIHDECGNLVEFKANPPHGLFAKKIEEAAEAAE